MLTGHVHPPSCVNQALYHRLGLTKPDPSKGKPTLTADSPELLVW